MDKDDEYSPASQNQNLYKFKALDSLVYNLEEYLEQDGAGEIDAVVHLCPYKVTNDGATPFLQYLLQNVFGHLYFVSLGRTIIRDNSIIDYSTKYLHLLLIEKKINLEESTIEYKGTHVEKGSLFIFFDVTKCELNINDSYKSNQWWFTLPSEIINGQRLTDLTIDEQVANLFYTYPTFAILHDANGAKYEVPQVGYVSKRVEKTCFTYTFGETARNSNELFGAYYYFTNFANCIKQLAILEEYEKESVIGIIRFALFLKKHKIVENLLTDPVDDSLVKKERYGDPNMDANYERLTARISDHDGKWTEQFDSIILSNVQLDNGSFIKNVPVFCVKEYEQQYPLSYHFISRKYIERGIL
jgi:hypothetical protein